MMNLQGSWVAMPTPFTEDNKIDYQGFETLINRQIKYGTSQLFVLGSAGEGDTADTGGEESDRQGSNLHGQRENSGIFQCFLPYHRGERGVCTVLREAGSRRRGIYRSALCSDQPASAHAHLDTCMGSVDIPCGIYNNPSRLGVQVLPETIKKLSDAHPNFVVDKEAMGSVEQLVQVQRLCEGKVKIMCCDFPKYSIVIPTLAVGGTGTANIGGNIIPEEAALYSRPWTSMEIMEECRANYFKWFPLLQALYTFSNPVVIKAALSHPWPAGRHLRKPYQEYTGQKLADLETMMGEMGVIDKYGVK